MRAARTLLALTAILLLPTFRASGQNSNSAETDKTAVEHVLNLQRDAWNHHDLEGFMAGYWNSPELTFFSGATMSSGWQATIARYRKKYQGEGREMGHLEFSDLNIQVLAADAAFVRGAWELTLPDGKKPHGLFTLVFRKFPDGWKILHDHTSAAE
jgi:ketosteroid isomerase-like protein